MSNNLIFGEYTYIIIVTILMAAWALFYYFRKDLRRLMLFSSFIAIPLGFTERFIVPEYWHPVSIFGLVDKFGIGIESFIYTFALGGIAAVVFPMITNRGIVKKPATRKWRPYFFFFIILVLLEIIMPDKSIYNFMASFLLTALFICNKRRDLAMTSIVGGILFVASYIILFKLLLAISPETVRAFYNFENISSFLILGIPIEEYVIIFTAGTLWSVLAFYIDNLSIQKK